MRIHERNNPGPANALIHSGSPYLRQHAHNPVDWMPWGLEAIDKAIAEDKPILLSVGYSTCYWCHVMEREVFVNPSIAEVMNKHFINVKVDREEHPQVDEIYMMARQLMTKEGGWPNNVFLTPELMPFFAGGTFSATAKYGKPAFTDVLHSIAMEWRDKKDEIKHYSRKNAELMQGYLMAEPGAPTDISQAVATARAQLAKHHDAEAGGFFQAPKFPQENYLQFLLTHYDVTGDSESLEMAAFSLRQMAAGGINDQVGAGFHRYAVDRNWMVPHFEKMLYTQGLLARAYAEAARITGNPYLEEVAHSICDFVGGPLTDGRGAFYSAIDAENDGVEGEYYAWTTDELEQILSRDEIDFFIHHYMLADIPHFPGHKHPNGEVLLLRAPIDEQAAQQKLAYHQIAGICGSVMNKMLARRNLRISPNLDDKIIVGWNGLMIDGLAYAGMVFGKKDYVERAHKAAEHLLRYAIDNNGQLMRCIMQSKAQHLATLEDYAYFIKGLLTLHEADASLGMLTPATQLMNAAEQLFSDADAPGFFTSQDSDIIPMRIKNADDSALPNANAVMAENYLNIARLTGDENYRAKAKMLVDFFLSGERTWLEYTTMLGVAMRLSTIDRAALPAAANEDKIVTMKAEVTQVSSQHFELTVTLAIKEGWTIKSNTVMDGTGTRMTVQAPGIKVLGTQFPKADADYRGNITVKVKFALAEGQKERPEIRILLGYHPCNESACFAAVNDAILV